MGGVIACQRFENTTENPLFAASDETLMFTIFAISGRARPPPRSHGLSP
jgi:hypothetical protein